MNFTAPVLPPTLIYNTDKSNCSSKGNFRINSITYLGIKVLLGFTDSKASQVITDLKELQGTTALKHYFELQI